MEVEDEENRNLFGPSLKQIVKNYVMELNESQKKIDGEVYLDRYRDSRTIETQGGLMELKECLRQDPFAKDILSMHDYDTTIVEERQNQYFNWLKLLKALHEVQDVSMKGIQLFKEFRLHCEIDNLPWPLPESSATMYNKLMLEM